MNEYLKMAEKPNSQGLWVLKKCKFGSKKETIVEKFTSKLECMEYARKLIEEMKTKEIKQK